VSWLLGDQRQNDELQIALVKHAAHAAATPGTMSVAVPTPMTVLTAPALAPAGTPYAAVLLRKSMSHNFSVSI
jgi:hypothetical protein